MIAIIDYDVGNLKNVHTALGDVGLEGIITRDPAVVESAEAVILPGVGAFKDAMDHLDAYGLIPVLKEVVAAGKPLLGICLGMQILFDKSYEDGEHQGLGLIPGEIVPFTDPSRKIPHMGWNNLVVNRDDGLASGISAEDHVYFVHSYYAAPADFAGDVVAYADYGVRVPGIVRLGNVMGMQFHPEKSGSVGTKLLKNFRECIK